jgi:succinoglycan biosynthesis transport protein ExoP
MNFQQFTRVLGKNIKWLILFPSLIAVLVYFLTAKTPKEYVSTTSIYTGIASGANLSSGEGMAAPFDFFAVNNAFDNLLVTIRARQTLEDVAIKLLAKHLLLQDVDPAILSQEGFLKLQERIPPADRSTLVGKNEAETIEKISKEYHSTGDNIIAQLINDNKGFYSIEILNYNLTAERKQASDFLDISYKSSDPGVAVWTIKFLSESFISKYKYLKGSETINVVKWFEARLREAAADLNNSENKLKDFGVRNKIINYHEQSKFLAEEKETNETDYYKELMNYEGSKRGIARLEDKLESREILLKNNEELNKRRKELGALNETIERAKIYGNTATSIQPMINKANTLKKEIQLYVLQYYSLNNTIESVPQDNMLNRWLEETLNADGSEARLKVHIDRRKEFDRQYAEFSPLGMQLNRLDREVDVAERQYLEILHGLHLAKLRQQNIEMSNNLQIMDNPSYPTKPLPSKRLLLIIIAFLAGFFLLLTYFMARAILDASIKDTVRAEMLTNLKIFSALPATGGTNLNAARMENTLLDYAVSNLKIELEANPEMANNYLITIISNREQEGKTYAANKLAEKLYSLDYSVLFITNDERVDDVETEDRKFRTLRYDVNSKLFSARSEQNLLPEFTRVNKEAYNFIILEIPAISMNAIPNQLIKNAKLSLMLLDSRRIWTSSDNYILNLFKKASNNDNKIMVWLNYVAPENLENLVGATTKSGMGNVKSALVKA